MLSIGNRSVNKIYIGNKQIAKVMVGKRLVYSAGNIVTYYVDTDVAYQEEVDADETVLSPKSFIPAKEGWEFAGWRLDTEASSNVLEELTMGDDPIELYAVFKQEVTLSYDSNGGSGSTAAETKERFYNNEAVSNPSFELKTNNFSRSSASWLYWAMGSVSGPTYAANESVMLEASTTFYAKWQLANATLDLSSLISQSGASINNSGYIEYNALYANNVIRTLYEIDTTKYSGFTVKCGLTTFNMQNPTVGQTTPTLMINNTIIRKGIKQSNENGGAETEATGTPGYKGQSFTITVNNADSIFLKLSMCSGTIYVGSAYGGSITLLGKIV